MLSEIEQQLLCDLYTAYYSARKNKRSTINQLRFEQDYEKRLYALLEQIIYRKYTPLPSICFVVKKPVKREIFAANFTDRVVHHYIYNKIYPLVDKQFIYDSYSCRLGKGTRLGIKRLDYFIRSCSRNYSADCYILKLDIKAYFMAMNKSILFRKIEKSLQPHKQQLEPQFSWLMYLIHRTIFNEPTANCTVKGERKDWEGLPASKSLFRVSPQCGLPIGNLTSQLFGNIYMNDFDHWVKKQLNIRYYGRYVDDFVLVHRNKYYLQSLIPYIADYLQSHLQLTLHPNKIYLQHYSKGVKYLGAVVLPHRMYVANRTKGNFYDCIKQHNAVVRTVCPTLKQQELFRSSMNSYLGIMQHYSSFKIRKLFALHYVHQWWMVYFSFAYGFSILLNNPRKKVKKVSWTIS